MAIINTAPAIVQLTQIDCGNCGGSYAISERYRKQMQEEAGTWHCPYCRIGWGYGESEIDKLKKQAAAARAEYSRRSEKAAKTRIKNRVANGVCPCCKRSFENLHRHMKSQHPDFAAQTEETR